MHTSAHRHITCAPLRPLTLVCNHCINTLVHPLSLSHAGIWSPYIAFSNLKWLPQDRVVRYGFGFDPNSDAVFQWRSVHATYFTPMDLRAFPFDRQQLLIQVGRGEGAGTGLFGGGGYSAPGLTLCPDCGPSVAESASNSAL
jgi:hypothetical protein